MKSVAELMNLRGRTALVTGGAGHIGGTICEALAELGASIAVLDQDAARCEALAGRLAATYGVPTTALPVDLGDEAAVRAVPAAVVERLGSLDILVHCAALVGTTGLQGWAVPFDQQSADTWRAALDINLTSAFILTQAAAEALAKSGRASVINIGSIYGVSAPDLSLYEGTNLGNPAAYAASKGGLWQLTRWLSTVLAPRVRVNMISPGGVERGQPESFRERYVRRVPLARMATEEDLKGAAAFLASDLSAYVTGQNLVVDGGWTAW
jgi:NAD(P)-dependent dehydrogenase (short-subunit alcohol dehydrogenase family)